MVAELPLLKWLWPGNQPPPSDHMLDSISQQILKGQEQQALKSLTEAFSDLTSVNPRKLDKSEIPAQLIYGSYDPLLQFIDPFKNLKSSTLVTVEGASHIDIMRKTKSLEAVHLFLLAQDYQSIK